MFGDDPDTTEKTPRVGSGQLSDAREGGCGLTRGVYALHKEGFRGLAVGSGLCRWSREGKNGKPDNNFRRPKTSDVRPAILPL